VGGLRADPAPVAAATATGGVATAVLAFCRCGGTVRGAAAMIDAGAAAVRFVEGRGCWVTYIREAVTVDGGVGSAPTEVRAAPPTGASGRRVRSSRVAVGFGRTPRRQWVSPPLAAWPTLLLLAVRSGRVAPHRRACHACRLWRRRGLSRPTWTAFSRCRCAACDGRVVLITLLVATRPHSCAARAPPLSRALLFLHVFEAKRIPGNCPAQRAHHHCSKHTCCCVFWGDQAICNPPWGALSRLPFFHKGLQERLFAGIDSVRLRL